MLIAFVDIKINYHRLKDTRVNKQTIPSFKILNIKDSNIDLVRGDSSLIEITSMKDSLTPMINYSVKGDTLMVSDTRHTQNKNNNLSIRIFSTDSLKCIIMNNSDMNINNYNSARINLNMDNSNIWFNQDNKTMSLIQSLDILAKNHSSINSNKFKIGNIEINLQKSDANLEVISNKINGTLSDSSSVSIDLAGKITLKTDSTSKVNVNN
jgi:hypothetical protein